MSQSKPELSLHQVLAELHDVEVLLWSADTAPVALKREFVDVPSGGVIVIVKQIKDLDRRKEVEGALLLYTPWKILQRVLLEDREVALLLIPAT